MNQHEIIRRMLPLAASGDISPGQLRRVQQHLAGCQACRQASQDFASLASALRSLPTPQPDAELVARVQLLARARLAGRRAASQEWRLLATLVAASWVTALLSWPLIQAAVGWFPAAWQLPVGSFATVLAAYSILGLLLACLAAFAVGRQAKIPGRIQ